VLVDVGWFQWTTNDRPATRSAVTMACHAFTFLFLDGPYPHMRMTGVQAMISYLHDEMGHFPGKPDLQALRALLDVDPPKVEHVHEWFHRVYPAPRAR
jgi:hypothetical protein